MSVSHTQIRQAIADCGIPCDSPVRCADGEYSLPDENYMASLGRRYRDFLFAQGVTPAEERMDCDNCARLVVALGKFDHGRHFHGETGLAIAEAGIITDTLLHMVVLAVHDVGGKLVVKFYESIPEGTKCLNEFTMPVRRLLSVSF